MTLTKSGHAAAIQLPAIVPLHLPGAAQVPGSARDALLLRVIGSPDPYAKHTDGMGGATSSTSRVIWSGSYAAAISCSLPSMRWAEMATLDSVRGNRAWPTFKATADAPVAGLAPTLGDQACAALRANARAQPLDLAHRQAQLLRRLCGEDRFQARLQLQIMEFPT